MKYIPDTTGRFNKRPYYEPAELDQECERIITRFMQDLYGRLILPIPTDALTKLIEHEADDLDLYADLSSEGSDIQGITEIYIGTKPKVKISKDLSSYSHREYRLRTTLTHEFGHVKFHSNLWQAGSTSLKLFDDVYTDIPLKCNRDSILNASTIDWMEWQAGYICGAILMPISQLRYLIVDYLRQNNLNGPIQTTSPDAQQLMNKVVELFHVSKEASRMRLLKLGYLTDSIPSQRLFQ